MAAGDTTQGRARPNTAPWHLEAGDYCVRVDSDSGERIAWVVTPNGNGPARLETWDLTEHDDGTITTHPSILAHPTSRLGADDQPEDVPGWHGYLERGVWREV
jgi:hypothetical protein